MTHPEFVTTCLALARQARPVCAPNPAVGCVLVATDGRVIGQGHTQPVGAAHAEIMALRDARQHGADVRGATAYVSLEPCAHQGRTGPCCDALIHAGIGKVVASLTDPNPLVAGKGFARLRQAGVEVEIGSGAAEAFELNIGFFSRMQRGRPWVRSKIAASLDGKTALPDGRSQWITSPEARADGMTWRACADAVMSGIGTVLQDDPLLTVRSPDSPGRAARQPALVLLDSQLRTPPTARLFQTERHVWVYSAATPEPQRQALQATGAVIVPMPSPDGSQVDLNHLLADLGQREVNQLHVEAGPGLNAALAQARLVDEWLVYVAPKWLGQGRDMLPFGPLPDLAHALSLQWQQCDRVGPDLRLRLRQPGGFGYRPESR